MIYHSRNSSDPGQPILPGAETASQEANCTNRRRRRRKRGTEKRLAQVQNKRGKISPHFSEGKEAALPYTLPLIKP